MYLDELYNIIQSVHISDQSYHIDAPMFDDKFVSFSDRLYFYEFNLEEKFSKMTNTY